MVKGISRQIILVDTPDPKLFEQAIFILKDNVGEGITEEQLMKQARQVIRGSDSIERRRHIYLYGVFWAAGGALLTGFAWLLTALI